MRLGYIFWAIALLSAFCLAREVWIRRRRKVEGRSKAPYWRLALIALPLLAILGIVVLAWTGTRHIHNFGSAFDVGDLVKAESFFADRVNLGSDDYVERAEYVKSTYRRVSPFLAGKAERKDLLPLIDPYDPGHLYVLPVSESTMPGFTLYRLRLSCGGWKIDQVVSRGCVVSREESLLMRRLVDIPGWW
jgi:hypothetical protein